MVGTVKVVRKVSNKKEWNPDVLVSGGISHYNTSELPELDKDKYRVALAKGDCETTLKWKVKTATGHIFSVQSKMMGEAQAIVDIIYGKGHYRVSQMLV